MKKTILIVLAALSFACTKHESDCPDCGRGGVPDNREGCSAVFVFNTAATTEQISRAVDENSFGDIHLFMFGPQKYYSRLEPRQGSTLILKDIAVGQYEVFAVTNYDGTHSGMSKSQLEALTFSGVEQDVQGRIPMTFRGTFDIAPNKDPYHEIELVRGVAKAAFTVSVAAGCDVEIIGHMMCNVPDRGNLFPSVGTDAHDNSRTEKIIMYFFMVRLDYMGWFSLKIVRETRQKKTVAVSKIKCKKRSANFQI